MRLPKEVQIWGPAVLKDSLRRIFTPQPPVQRLWVAICDHYEPFYKNDNEDVARDRVALWRKQWPAVAARHCDSTGKPPQYTFFYPQEEYRPHLMDSLAEMAAAGIADVEIHIHHGGEGRGRFIERMSGFQQALFNSHGLLRKWNGKLGFGFIHGNWCLDNSNPNMPQACGLNDEIGILRDLGCYADFTMPSGQHPSQARLINRIYWATDDPSRPKSYDWGRVVEPGANASGDLLMIPGPLGLRWRGLVRKPYYETGEIAGYQPLSAQRISDWIRLAPRIGQDSFIKLYTHGTQTRTSGPFFAGGMLDRLFALFEEATRHMQCTLRYVTAWQMRQAVDAAATTAPQ